MKQTNSSRSRPRALGEERSGCGSWRRGALTCAALTLAAAGWVGCGQEASQQADANPADVRGDPITAPAAIAVSPPSTGATGALGGVRSIPLEASAPTATGGTSTVAPAVPPTVATAGGTAPASMPPPAPAPAPAPEAGGGQGTAASPLLVGFEKLGSFQYTLPDGPVDTNTVTQTQAAAQIPSAIKALNNQFVSLKGFMLPLKVEKGLVTELLIMRDQSMCCYGTVPRINEWVSVKMVSVGVKPVMDQAVTFFGKLKVGEMYENGYLVGIYAMDGEKMAGPLDL